MTAAHSEHGLWGATVIEGPDTQSAEALADKKVDIAIIGGGFTGCAAALVAAEAGATTALIEAKRIGFGGSGRNVGLVNAGLWTPPAEVEKILEEGEGARLNAALAAGPALVFSWIARYGLDCEASRNGTLHLAADANGERELERRAEQLQARGAPVILLDAADTERRTGSTRFKSSLFDPRAGTIQPLSYVRGLARAAVKAGAQIVENAPVRRIERVGGLWRIDLDGAMLLSDRLLIATNAYGQLRGAPRQCYTPVSYFQASTQPLPGDVRRSILRGGEGAWDTAEVMSSFRLDAAGRLLIGGVGGLAAMTRPAHLDWAGRKLAKVFPQAAGCDFEHFWSGRIAMTSDHLPRIVQFGSDGAGLALYGYSGRGIAPGAVFGRAAALSLLEQEDCLPIAPIAAQAGVQLGFAAAFYEFGATATHLLAARI